MVSIRKYTECTIILSNMLFVFIQFLAYTVIKPVQFTTHEMTLHTQTFIIAKPNCILPEITEKNKNSAVGFKL